MKGKLFFSVLLCVFSALCIFTDLRSRKIPNKFTITFAAIGIVGNIYYYSFWGLLNSILGLIAALVILIIPYLSKGIFAGDVKMLMAIGAMMGVYFVIGTSMYMAILGGAFALIIMIRKKRLQYYLRKINFYFLKLMLLNTLDVWEDDSENLSKLYMPYSLAIGIGALCFLRFHMF